MKNSLVIILVLLSAKAQALPKTFEEMSSLFSKGQGARLSDFHQEELWKKGNCLWGSNPSSQVSKAIYFTVQKTGSNSQRIVVFSPPVADLSEFPQKKAGLLEIAKSYGAGSLSERDGKVFMDYKYAKRPALLTVTFNSGNLMARWEQDAEDDTDLMYCIFDPSQKGINP